jgi:hypothetical protein
MNLDRVVKPFMDPFEKPSHKGFSIPCEVLTTQILLFNSGKCESMDHQLSEADGVLWTQSK